MKYLSLFSGIGGFELGIQQAYESNHANGSKDRGIKEDSPTDKRQRLLAEKRKDARTEKRRTGQRSGDSADEKPLCVGFSEVDQFALKIYQTHFPEHKNYGDITKIEPTYLPDFDIIVGGFPCQSFSVAGNRRGFEDTRGTLFFEIARIIKVKKPRLLLLENVKGLLSHDEGRTFKTIISALTDLGYDVQWQVLNSKNYGVPQNRERVFIVGHLRGTARPQVFPFGGADEEDTRIVGQDVAREIDRHYSKGTTDLHKSPRSVVIQQFGELRESEISPTLRTPTGGHRMPMTFEGTRIRRLTPKECERLQGFPDDWTIGVSDTQRYKTCGNAVTVNVIQAIMEKLL